MTSIDAPEVVVRYLQAAPGGDVDTLVGCFTDDAEVIDEDQTFRGHDEIRRWRETVASKFTYTIDVEDVETLSAHVHVVTARLEGDFPGSPVQLDFRFILQEGLISALSITA